MQKNERNLAHGEVVFKLFECNIQGEIVRGKSAYELILSFAQKVSKLSSSNSLSELIAQQTDFLCSNSFYETNFVTKIPL